MVCTFRYSYFWQDIHLVSKRWVDLQQAIILANGCVEIVAPLVIGQIELSPGRGQEYTPMLPVGLVQGRRRVLGGQVLNGGRRINDASIEEDPTGLPDVPCPALVICRCGSQSTARKLDWVEPRQSGATALQFVLDDPAAWFRHDSVATPAELGQQRRLPSARTSRDHDKSFAEGARHWSAAVSHLIYLCVW